MKKVERLVLNKINPEESFVLFKKNQFTVRSHGLYTEGAINLAFIFLTVLKRRDPMN